MAKKSKAIMVVGPIILSLVAILAVYFVLISSGVITAREYTLKIEAISREKEYDGTPLTLGENDYRIVEGEDLLEAHNHHVVVHFEGNQIDAGTCDAKMIVSVFDSTNADVTKRYNIETTNGVITVNPRSVTIRTYGATYAYDGNEHTVEELTNTFEVIDSNPVRGHKLSFTATGKIREIGEMPVDVAISVMDDDGNQINPANYRVFYEDTEENPRGKIVIRPRNIYLDNYDIQEFFYDGQVHDFNSSLMTNVNYGRSELEGGCTISYIKNTMSAVDVNNPRFDEDGNYLYDSYLLDNFEIKVMKNGVDVSEYYQIDPNCTYVQNSKMTIKPIELTLTTLSHEKPYDGIILDPARDDGMKNAYIIQNLGQVPGNEKVEVQFNNSITDVYRDDFKNVQGVENSAKLLITNSRGEDTSINYNIHYDFGTLTIKPREMTLKTYSDQKLFDGDTLYGNGVKNEDGENYSIIVGDVAPNQELFVSMESKISNVGIETNSITKYYVKDKAGNEVTDNYQITLEEGELEILPVAISISTASHMWNYDGKEHSDENASVQGLPNACSIEYFNYPKLTDATLDEETGMVYTVDNIPDFIIYDRNKNVVYDSSNDKTPQDNFSIAESSWGEIGITPLEMTIYTESSTKTYDGSLCFNHNYNIENKRDGDKVELSWPNDITFVQRDENKNVIAVENKPKVTIFDSKNKDISKNYLIHWNCGELKVNPVYLSVTSKNVAKLYDGTPIEVTPLDYDISTNVLIGNDHIANIRTINDYVDVKKENGTVVGKDNIVKFDILDENNRDVSGNYSIDFKTVGKLTISPIEVTISTKADSFLFDGDSHIFDQEYTVTCGGGDLPSVIGYTVTGFTPFVFAPTNDNYYTNSCTVSFFNNFDNSKPMTDNIKLIEDFGKIYVGKADVVVRTGSAEKLYDGTKLECNDVYIEGASKEFLDGIGATWTIDESEAMDPFINVERGANGKVKGINNKITLKFTKEINGKITDITSSINVIYEYGTLTITPVHITVYTEHTKDAVDNTYSKEWDGTDIYDNNIVFTDEDQAKLTALGITDVVAKSDYTKFSDAIRKSNRSVDKAANKVTPIFYQGSKEFDADNLEIDNQTGYLKILPIPVEVITKKAAATLDGIVKKTYDGTTLYDNEIAEATQNALAPYGITIEVIDGGEGLTNVLLKNGNVLTVSNTIKYRFMKGVEEVSKDNFLITDSTGKLRIDPVEITVQTEKSVAAGGSDVTAIYGQVDKLEDYELVIPTGSLAKLNALGLAKSNLVVTYHTKLEEVVRDNKGNAIAVENDITVVIKDNNNADITDNFKINYDTGKLKLIALNFTVGSGSKTFSYNGFEHYIEGGGLEVIKGSENLIGYTYNFTNVNPTKVTNVKVDKDNKATSYDNVVEYKLVIKDSNNKDVTNNFTWDNKWGTLKVEPAVIHVNAPGAKKVFDNEELTNDEISIVNDSYTNILNDLNHQIINLKTTGSQLTAGKSAQTYTYNVIDKGNNDADVTSNYKLVNLAGNSDLEVEQLKITIYSGSDTKIYDGDPLTCEECEVFPGLPSGFTVNVTYTGSQTEIGIGPNTFTVELIDCDGVSFSGTSKYKNSIEIVQKYLGDLEVLPYVTGSGNLLASTPTPDPTINSFSIVVSKPGVIYLRDRSYGDYNGNGWDYIATSNAYINDNFHINPLSITTKALEDNSYASGGTITITMSSSLPYLIPYYSTTLYESDSHKITDDSHISVTHDSTPYTIDYYTYHYNLADLSLSDSTYIEFEDDYSLYAKTQYTAIPSALKAKLKQLGEENDIKVKDSDLIVKIADFFRDGSYVYDNFPNRNEASDIVEFFLKNKGGTCQDFATVATLMYRAYGIPARYVTGFAKVIDALEVDTEVAVNQTDAHAWVEIYINGMGWVNVEVTKGNDNNISAGGSTGGSLTGSGSTGDLSKQMDEPDDSNPLFKIYSNKVGNIYLRNTSYGDYTGLGFADATAIAYSNSTYNPLEYGANALNSKKFNISIDLTKNKYQGYLIPYYTSDSLKDYNDVYLDGDYGAIYEYQFTNAIVDLNNPDMVPSQLASYEMYYRSHVYDNYLNFDISPDLQDAFEDFIIANGIDKGDVDLELVRSAVQNSAEYTFDFNIPDACDDIVLWFLQNKKGVCQHYAATATMLYRYLGIPARYVTGVLGKVSKTNTWTNVTAKQAHAWVEVYLDGFGWAAVEVTGGDGGGGSGEAKKATIYPSTKHVLYGNPNYELQPNEVFLSTEYSELGYYVIADIIGEDPSLGIHTTKITDYTIYDKNDNDVTGEFDVVVRNGILQVYAAKITIVTESSLKEYDGTPLINHGIEEVDLSGLLSGHHFNSGAINFKDSASQTNVGTTPNDFTYSNSLITDEYDAPAVDQYWIVRGTGTLTVTKRNVELTADDAFITVDDFFDAGYDFGDKYRVETYSITGGSLLSGHEIVQLSMTQDSFLDGDENWFALNEINLSTVKVVDHNNGDEDVTSSYNFTAVDGILEMN